MPTEQFVSKTNLTDQRLSVMFLGSVLPTKYCAGDIIKGMRLVDYVAGMGERRFVCRFLVGKPEEKRPLGRPRRKWKDNIKMYL